jgi:hypothetical protein
LAAEFSRLFPPTDRLSSHLDACAASSRISSCDQADGLRPRPTSRCPVQHFLSAMCAGVRARALSIRLNQHARLSAYPSCSSPRRNALRVRRICRASRRAAIDAAEYRPCFVRAARMRCPQASWRPLTCRRASCTGRSASPPIGRACPCERERRSEGRCLGCQAGRHFEPALARQTRRAGVYLSFATTSLGLMPPTLYPAGSHGGLSADCNGQRR